MKAEARVGTLRNRTAGPAALTGSNILPCRLGGASCLAPCVTQFFLATVLSSIHDTTKMYSIFQPAARKQAIFFFFFETL